MMRPHAFYFDQDFLIRLFAVRIEGHTYPIYGLFDTVLNGPQIRRWKLVTMFIVVPADQVTLFKEHFSEFDFTIENNSTKDTCRIYLKTDKYYSDRHITNCWLGYEMAEKFQQFSIYQSSLLRSQLAAKDVSLFNPLYKLER